MSELVTIQGENLQLKIETGAPNAAQVAAGSVAMIECRAKFAGDREARAFLPRIYRDGHSGTKSGENRYSNFVNQNKNGNPFKLQRMFIDNPNVDKLKLRRGGRDIYDKTLAQNNYDLKTNGQVPVAGVFLYDSVQEGYAATDAMNAIGNFEFIVNLTTAGDFEAIYQGVEMLRSPVMNPNFMKPVLA